MPKPPQTRITIEQTIEKPSGIRISTHGIIYQLRLLMLFLIRAREHGRDFSLGTEVAEADKFDDVVFSCQKKDNSGKEYRFLQAKHRLDDTKTIKPDQLLSTSEDDFDVLKYFISYRKIKQNTKFDGELKDFIFYTNIDLSAEVQQSVEAIDSSDDDILSHKNNVAAKQYKFKIGSDLHNKLVSSFKTNHFEKLATSVARLVANNGLEPDSLILCYRGWLLDNVFKLETVKKERCIKIHDKFLDDQCNGDAFLKQFKGALTQSYSVLKKGSVISDINNILQNVMIKVPRNFNLDSKGSLSLNVSDAEVDEFFNKFVLAVRQPNVDQLDSIIMNEMGAEMKLTDSALISNHFLKTMLDWINEQKGRFLQSQHIEGIFNTLKQDFARSGLIGQSLINKFKFEKNYHFNNNVKVIKTLNNFFTNNTTQILTVYYKIQLLTVIKVLNASKTNEDDHMFLDLKSLEELIGSSACPKNAFSSSVFNNLIINIDPMMPLHDAKRILGIYFEILKNKPKKKIILIICHEQQDTAEDVIRELSQLHVLGEDMYTKLVDTDNNLLDLTPESQQKLLDGTNVKFQGKDTAINSLINDKARQLINEDMLENFICNEQIAIGKEPTDENYKKTIDYFIDRTFHRCISINKSIMELNSKFSIIYNCNVFESDLKGDQEIKEIVLISDHKNEFEELRRTHGDRTIHWFKQKLEYHSRPHNGDGNDSVDDDTMVVLPNEHLSERDIQSKPVIILVSDESNDFVELQQLYSDKVIYWVAQSGGFHLRGSNNVYKDLNEKENFSFSEENDIIVCDTAGMIPAMVLLSCRIIIMICNEHDCIKNRNTSYGNQKCYFINIRNTLLWQQSCGSVVELRKHVSKKQYVYTSQQVIASSDKVVIVDAEPGMGKSTLLTHLALNVERDQELGKPWVVKVELINYLKEFLHLSAVHIKETLKFLYNAAFDLTDEFLIIDTNNEIYPKFPHGIKDKRLNTFEVDLFTHFYNQGRVVVYLDGFDEISPDCKTVVLDLIETLKQTKVQKIWVTTRPYNIQSELENRLGSFAYEIAPLHENDQVEMFTRFWENRFNIKNLDQLSKIFIGNIWKLISQHMGSGTSNHLSTFTSIPLHVIMIATVYQNKFKEYYDSEVLPDLTENFTFNDLYDIFIKEKFNLAYKELYGSLPNRYAMEQYEKLCLENNRYLALFALFSEDELKQLLSEEKLCSTRDLIKTIMKAEEKTGIIDRVVDGKPHFIHRTFAEHLAAALLADMLQNDERNIARAFLYNILTNPGFQSWVLFKFLNYKLVKNIKDSAVLTAALNGDVDVLRDPANLNKIRDSRCRTPLHLSCCSHQHKNNMFDILGAIDDKKTAETILNFSVKDELFGWTPLHYAVVSMCDFDWGSYYDHLRLSCRRHKTNCLCHITRDWGDMRDVNGRTPLMLAIQLKHNASGLDFLINSHTDINIKDNDGRTALHYAIEYEQDDDCITSMLLEYGADLFVENNIGKTPLHLIFEYKNLKAWHTCFTKLHSNKDKLVTHISNILTKVDENVRTQFLYSDKSAFFLNNYLIDVNSQDSTGKTALHYITQNYDPVTFVPLVHLFTSYGANVNLQDNLLKTPLHYAIESGHAVKELLIHGAHFDVIDIDNLSSLHFLMQVNFVFNCVKTNDIVKLNRIFNDCQNNKIKKDIKYSEGINLERVSLSDANGIAFFKEIEDNIIVNAVSKHGGKSSLDFAAENGSVDVVFCLLSNGAWRFTSRYEHVKITKALYSMLVERNMQHETSYTEHNRYFYANFFARRSVVVSLGAFYQQMTLANEYGIDQNKYLSTSRV